MRPSAWQCLKDCGFFGSGVLKKSLPCVGLIQHDEARSGYPHKNFPSSSRKTRRLQNLQSRKTLHLEPQTLKVLEAQNFNQKIQKSTEAPQAEKARQTLKANALTPPALAGGSSTFTTSRGLAKAGLQMGPETGFSGLHKLISFFSGGFVGWVLRVQGLLRVWGLRAKKFGTRVLGCRLEGVSSTFPRAGFQVRGFRVEGFGFGEGAFAFGKFGLRVLWK